MSDAGGEAAREREKKTQSANLLDGMSLKTRDPTTAVNELRSHLSLIPDPTSIPARPLSNSRPRKRGRGISMGVRGGRSRIGGEGGSWSGDLLTPPPPHLGSRVRQGFIQCEVADRR